MGFEERRTVRRSLSLLSLVSAIRICAAISAFAATPGLAQTASSQPQSQEPFPASPNKANPFQPGQKLLATTPGATDPDSEPVPEDRCNPSLDRKNNGVLTDVGSLDFKMYLGQIGRIVYSSWRPLMPKEVDKPFLKKGEVKVCFSLLPTGKVEADSLLIARTSGDPALDRAAAGAIETAIFPPLPKEFPKKRLVLLYTFAYNPDRRPDPTRNLPKQPNPLGPVALIVGYTSKL